MCSLSRWQSLVGRRLAVWMVAGAGGVLGHSSASLAAGTPGEFFVPLQTGQFAAFDRMPAYQIRTYVKAALATYEKQCPETAPKYEIPWDLVAYINTPADRARGQAGAFMMMAVALQMGKFEVQANGGNDVKWLIEKAGCALSEHQDWINHGLTLLSDPRLAGPVPEARKMCEKRHTPDIKECPCFALGFDMEASPERRRQFLDDESPINGLNVTMADPDFAALVGYKCPATPMFGSPWVSTPTPTSPKAEISDENHRLFEGTYSVRRPELKDQSIYRGSATITRIDHWRYAFQWHGSPNNPKGTGTLSSTGVEFTLVMGSSRPFIFAVLPDGTLQGKGRDNAYELVPVDASAPDFVPPPSPPSRPTLRSTASSPEQCARLTSDIEKLRGSPHPRAADGIARLEAQFKFWCSR